MSSVSVAWKDGIVLLMSIIKLSEPFCLWRAGSGSLWHWTMVGWCHAFIAPLIPSFRLHTKPKLRSSLDHHRRCSHTRRTHLGTTGFMIHESIAPTIPETLSSAAWIGLRLVLSITDSAGTAALGLRPRWEDISFFNETSPVSERSLVLTLLAVALAASSICHAVPAPTQLDAQSKINGSMAEGHAVEQWKVEVRRLFQASLAQMQLPTLRVARGGWIYNDGYGRLWVPEPYEAAARMVKFNADGWLNGSVWGFCGLLFLAAAITLASIKTKDELWLTIWIRWGVNFGQVGRKGNLVVDPMYFIYTMQETIVECSHKTRVESIESNDHFSGSIYRCEKE